MNKLKVLAMNISKKNKIFRKIARKSMYVLKRTKYVLTGINKKIDDKTIVFSCFNGKSYTCSPKAIYEYMLSDEKYKDYKYIWFFSPEKINDYKFLEKNRNTKVISKNSKAYIKYLQTSKYWFFNYKIADFIKPKKEQVFTQCWHGTPLKRLGYDLVHYDNQLNTPKEMKKRYKMETEKFSYFISPSKYASGVFRSGWNMKELGKENIIIEKGYPRNDFLFKYTEKDVSEIKQRILGEDIKNKKIILYAPTYRANQHESGVGYVYKEEVDFSKMREKLGDEFIILFRPHYFIANVFDFEKYKGFVYDVSKVDDINELYVISDILITDYSSVFFDYANLKRPIIFYMYDLEYYRDKSNGFYFDVEKELPGKIIRTDDDLITEIIRVSKEFTYDERYKKFNEKFNYLDDGEASKRVVEEIIK
ncbi:MAG: CDP-glycerol glycerophosphotransferase family protein [Clostridia bacterium]|nr:CDP-glycerol glycerophosphotransferase family protein [Clostridia bacterium]